MSVTTTAQEEEVATRRPHILRRWSVNAARYAELLKLIEADERDETWLRNLWGFSRATMTAYRRGSVSPSYAMVEEVCRRVHADVPQCYRDALADGLIRVS